MFVLGTAGHVDHGKSSLLRLLTGQEPDRLPEEKKRGMTIDLNFVWLEGAGGDRIGIVDVPGHHRFVKNMISGTMTVDAFIFVLAADDGWMPQSEEHLQVLKSLGVRHGIGVVTKIDLVDEARASRVETELREKLAGAFSETIEVVRYSSTRPETLGEVRAGIDLLVDSLPRPRDIGCPRLWIDRVFVPTGLGVVATGTLREGSVKEGDELQLLPAGKSVVVRGIQAYHQSTREAHPVSRVALQLSRVQTADVGRGMLLQQGKHLPVTRTVDARARFFAPLVERNLSLSLHVGTLRAECLVIPFARGEGSQGSEHLVRLKLASPAALRSGDRFVLRSPGEEATLGAGIIIDPKPVRSHKLALANLSHWDESAAGWLRYALEKHGVVDLRELADLSTFSRAELEAATIGAGLHALGNGRFADKASWDLGRNEILDCLARFHRGQQWEIEKSKIKITRRELADVLLSELVRSGEIKRADKGYRLAQVTASLSPEELAKQQRLARLFEPGPPLSLRELEGHMKGAKETAWRMAKAGELVPLAEEHFVARARYEALRGRVEKILREKGQATTSELRVLLDTSRKHVVLLLEQMDKDRLTYFKDGVRRLLRS